MSDHDLLMRLDEKIDAMHKRLDGLVTQDEFKPVKVIAYGLVSSVLIAVLGAVIALVIKR